MPAKIYRDSAIMVFVTAALAFFLFGLHVALSLAAGAVLIMVNYTGFFLMVRRLVMGRNKALLMLLWLGKLFITLALVWLSIRYLKLNPIGLLVGLTLPIIAVIYEGMRSARVVANGRI